MLRGMARQRLDPEALARETSGRIGQEVRLARMNHGLSLRAAARLAGVAPETQRRVEAGDPHVQIATACQVGAAVGLRIWGRAYPAATPTLRDTGQLWIADWIRREAHSTLDIRLEVALGNLRAADLVIASPTEILHVEIERLLADFQAQFRLADAKRTLLAEHHQRPVRLILAIEDTKHNRQVVEPHHGLIASALPAGSREVLRAIRTGQPVGRDGLLWVRRRG